MIIVFAVFEAAGVEGNEADTAAAEGVIGAAGGDASVGDGGEGLFFGEVVHVVVAQEMIGRAAEFLDFGFNGGEVGEGFGVGLFFVHVFHVAQDGEEFGVVRAELGNGFAGF